VNAIPYAARLRAAEERLREGGADALVVAPSSDLLYLAGYAPMPMERPTALVVTPGARPTLIVPTLERPLALGCPAGGSLEIVDWGDDTDPYPVIAARLPSAGSVAIGDRIWGVHVLALQARAPGLRWRSAREILGPMRARKDEQELDALRRAAAGADAALADVLAGRLTGRSEIDVARTLRASLVEHGHTQAGFTIVASGPNSASPHHEPTDRVLAPGDAVVLDFGGTVDGYHSDLTRTIVVGEAPEELGSVHDIVRGAQTAAIEVVRPGIEIREVDRAARRVIEATGYGDRFIHRTGHGIGLELHEPPYASEADETTLEPGMTFSVEPGIYLDGRFGVRIEDIVTVTDDGVEVLNGSARELRVVG
jgi:D-alanyl-D-alanine dipeptidase